MFSLLSRLVPTRYVESWRSTQRRIAALEKSNAELHMLLERMLADAEFSPGPGVGMHGQEKRRAVIRTLFERVRFSAAIETGTYLGNTAGYLATEFGVPVYSSEIVPRFHHAARRYLRNVPNVRLRQADSRAFLRELSRDSALTAAPTFFYLDAHWYQDLPLADEVDIVAGAWRDCVVMIDDFKVPGDPGYAYDDYGPGKALDLDYLAPVVARHALSVFFPSTRAEDETGIKSGYAVLASPSLAVAAEANPLLRRA